MANDKKISELPIAETINTADRSILISNNADYQFDFATLLQFINSGLNAGANLTFGPVLPQNTSGKNGDVFINTAAGSFAQKIAGVWTIVYTIATGSSGDTTVLYGTTSPSTSTGNNGDTFINTVSGIFYKKTAGAWNQVFSMQTGPQGPQGASGTDGTNGTNGKTILNGTTNPANNLGTDGDFYINTSSYYFFGPKTAGIWGSGISLIVSGVQFEEIENKNTPNGYAGLDGSGKISAAQLPGYVDDVLEIANYASLPATGETGKIYITTDTNNEYRWSGSAYIQIVASPGTTDTVPEGATNKYFTVSRVLNAVLTGIGFGSTSAISATDSILQALGKLQAQITGLFKIPSGGASGQILAKNSNTDGDLHWINAPSGSGGGGSSEPSGQIKSFRVDYGAVGDGVTDDTAAVNAALASERVIEDTGDFHVSTNPTNTYGTPINGDIRITKTGDFGQPVQLNSDADKYQHICGLEYLSSFHKKLIAGTGVRCQLSGDSTSVFDGGTAGYDIFSLLQNLTIRSNFTNVTWSSSSALGLSNVSWVNTVLPSDLSMSTPMDLYILRYGINDAQDGKTAKQSIDLVESGLATIRANSNFTKDKLSIILCTPNTHQDHISGSYSGEIWIEDYRKGLKSLARKYQCVFFDTYAMWQDARNASDYMGDRLHPQSVFYAWQADKLFNVIFPSIFRPVINNNFVPTNVFTATQPPSDYPLGLSQFEASSTFPVQGQVITFRSKGSNGTINQYVHGRGFYGNQFWYRSGSTSDGWFPFIRLLDGNTIASGIYTTDHYDFTNTISTGLSSDQTLKGFSVTPMNSDARSAIIASISVVSGVNIRLNYSSSAPAVVGSTFAWTAFL